MLALALLPDGWLASGSADKTIKLWDLDQRREVSTLRGHILSVVSLKVLKNGHLVSCSADDSLKIWNPKLKENNLLLTIGHGNTYLGMALFGVLPNDFLVTCSRGGEGVLKMHDSNNVQRPKIIPTGQKDAFSLLVLSSDQVVLGFKNGSIKIFDLEGGESKAIDQAHGSDVYSLFQLSNRQLISAGLDDKRRTIKIWNLADLSLLQSIVTDHSYSIQSIDVSKDEAFLATGSGDKSIKIWPIH